MSIREDKGIATSSLVLYDLVSIINLQESLEVANIFLDKFISVNQAARQEILDLMLFGKLKREMICGCFINFLS